MTKLEVMGNADPAAKRACLVNNDSESEDSEADDSKDDSKVL